MSMQIEKTFRVQGMACTGCEALIEHALRGLPGVHEVHASFASHSVTVQYDPDRIRPEQLRDAAQTAGYDLDIALEPQHAKPQRTAPYLWIAVVLLALYLIFGGTVSAHLLPSVSASMGYGMLFVVGLLTSLHCVAMCGGISMCVTGGTAADAAKPDVRRSLLYNVGRVISYTAIGGIVGGIGSVISLSGWARGIIPIVSGLCMVIMGLGMSGRFPWLNKFVPHLPRALREKAGAAGKGKGPLIVGLLNGLMPCGPLQAMQAYALGTGSVATGALSMFFFSLGTLPLMFGFGAVITMLGNKFQKKMIKISAVLVAVLGVVLIGRGFALSGFALPSAAAAGSGAATTAQVSTQSNVQNLTTDLTSGGYPTITVQKGVPVVWNLKADAGVLNGCNGTLIIPAYNLQVKLKAGDNIIKFTPEQSGTIPYSCWMGMITAKINVVDDVTKASAQNAPAQSPALGSSSAPQMPCCQTFN